MFQYNRNRAKRFNELRPAIDWALSIHAEYGVWPSKGALAHELQLSRRAAGHAIGFAKIVKNDPDQIAALSALSATTKKGKGDYQTVKKRQKDEKYSHYICADEMVYFVLSPTQGAVKIGFSSAKNFKSRVSVLQTANPALLTVLATIPGTRETENEMHLRFKALYIGRGEWFYYREPLISFISALSQSR